MNATRRRQLVVRLLGGRELSSGEVDERVVDRLGRHRGAVATGVERGEGVVSEPLEDQALLHLEPGYPLAGRTATESS